MSGALPRKVLIANRGEIAVRIARTCREVGVGTVAVFSDVDAAASHVSACDEAVRIGGAAPADSYLRFEAIVEAAQRTGADAVHPGYGFLAENAAFARAVADAGLTWIGPPPAVIEAMGDKLEAKRRMVGAGVPLLPGAELDPAADADSQHVQAAGHEVGFPLVVKAAAGGGGKGMRVVRTAAELAGAVAAARREAARAFGDDRVLLERFVARPRHLEVQILGDDHGGLVHLHERECSIQRRHQKVIEESPAPGIDDEVRAALTAAAIDAATAIGYVNAGTVEFVADEALLARRRAGAHVDPGDTFAFLEVNTRLQVEHPVTEEALRVRTAAGALDRIDLVRLQLLIAAGARLPFAQGDVVPVAHAVEARLYAEDPANDYLPVTGTIAAFQAAPGTGVRYDVGIRAGDRISPHYDPLLAKVIASAPTRVEAASRLAHALDRTLLHGTTTNRDLLVAILRDERFRAGDTTTAFLDERFGEPTSRTSAPDDATEELALVAVALAGAVQRGMATAVLPTVPAGFTNAGSFDPEERFAVAGRERAVRYRPQRDGSWSTWTTGDGAPASPAGLTEGPPRRVTVHGVERHPARDAGSTLDLDLTLDLEVAGHRRAVTVVGADGAIQVITPAGRVELTRADRFPDPSHQEVAGATRAPMPGSVVAVAVDLGATVARGELLVTVEAMKMEHRITAPFDGIVADLQVAVGQQVDTDEVLVVVERLDPA